MANDLSKYKEVREWMYTADLLTYDGDGAVAWAIQKWSPGANHAGMVLHLPEYAGEFHRRWTMEATGHGVRMAFLSELLEKVNGEVWWHPLRTDIPDLETKRNAAGCWALERQGVVKYDFKGLLQFPFKKVSADINRLVCSEYVQFAWGNGKIIPMLVGAVMNKPSDLPLLDVTLPPTRIVCHKPFIQVPAITVEP